MVPSTRPARPKRSPGLRPPRASDGPLSAAAMATFRCPTRADFLHELRSPPRARARSFAHGERIVPQVADNEREEEGSAPPHQSVALLDALDRLEEFAELKAIAVWLDELRTRRGFALSITDMDLSNGIALLDALYIVDSSLFAEIEYQGGDDDVGVPVPYVERKLDADGEAAARNIERLRALLAQFAWRDVDEDGRRLPPLDFGAIDVWALGGFVVVAAFTCEEAPNLVAHLDAYEDWVREALEDVVWRGLQALRAGVGEGEGERTDGDNAPSLEPRGWGSSSRGTLSDPASAAGSTVGDEGVRYWKARVGETQRELKAERKRRVEAEHAAESVGTTVDAWEVEVKCMKEMTERLRRELGKQKAEVKRLRGGASVLREANGGAKDVGMMQMLRSENARLRRKVAELERAEALREKERVRREKQAIKGGAVKWRGST